MHGADAVPALLAQGCDRHGQGHRRFAHPMSLGEMGPRLDVARQGAVFGVRTVDPSLAILANRDLLHAALANLLQNAFKYTQENSMVTLSAYASGEQVLIDVEDHCGGLPPGGAAKMFIPFSPNSDSRAGLGLGLSIARQSIEADNGTLTVRDVPGSGCVFTISLPRPSPS
ncbi:putative signal transduction histidine kinase [Variovorax paradoxus B4]|uniref:histidine kinase n=2 Tax=Variovorax paradoxus TaxID=34073 RepID=T1XJX5_VARPD|nr:putative signal transduction histidine kinase [Variovorax paradoxus B4]